MTEVTYSFLPGSSGVLVHFDRQIVVFSGAEIPIIDRRTKAVTRALLQDALDELDELEAR